MKKLLIAGLLCLGFAAAEDGPKNYENIGNREQEFYQFTGPVKTIKECTWLFKTKDCKTYEFNKFGIPLENLRNRKLLSIKDNIYTFEVERGDKKFIEIYKNLYPIKYGYYDDSNELVVDEEFDYDEHNRLLSHTMIIPFDGEYNISKSIYTYLEDNSYTVTEDDGFLKTVQTYKNNILLQQVAFIDGIERQNINYFYRLDKYGNWTEKYEKGILSSTLVATREITYH